MQHELNAGEGGELIWLDRVSWPQTDRCSITFVEMKRIELRGREEHLGCRGLGSICGEQESEPRFRGWAGCEWVRERHHPMGGAGGSWSQGAQAVLEGGRKGAPSFIKRRLPHSNSAGNNLKLLQNCLSSSFSFLDLSVLSGCFSK